MKTIKEYKRDKKQIEAEIERNDNGGGRVSFEEERTSE